MANLGYLQLTRDCVQACRFCSNPPTGEDLTETQMRAAIDDLVELGYDGVILTGGEPTCSPLLVPTLRYAAERGLQSRIITNGQLLADRSLFERCVAAGLEHLHLSLQSHRPAVHDFITQNPGSFDRAMTCLSHVPHLGVTGDINTVIHAYNSDHLDDTVRWLCEHFPFLRHFVWNNLDPEGPRTAQNPDCIPRVHEFQVALERAMDFLHQSGRTFRAERVPLCGMPRYAWAATETRKIIKEEERSVRFLDAKGVVRQREFLHDKGAVCEPCRYDPICAGMYSMGRHYDEAELSPLFDDPVVVVQQVLSHPPSPDLTARILARRGRRAPSAEPAGIGPGEPAAS